jgi:hypothetical protein
LVSAISVAGGLHRRLAGGSRATPSSGDKQLGDFSSVRLEDPGDAQRDVTFQRAGADDAVRTLAGLISTSTSAPAATFRRLAALERQARDPPLKP